MLFLQKTASMVLNTLMWCQLQQIIITSNKKYAEKSFNDCNASVYATIMREWRIIDKSLTETIYVQVYESRIDLLRAVIIGAPGTPYHEGLFFFDIVLPHDYPHSPPQVYYHSHGYRLNPNLYANGYVCLSLINTWEGRGIEKWSKESTLLQILVSILGLVLNELPFFNEPGFSKYNKQDEECMKQAFAYNEIAFILSCRTMQQIIKKPPNNFEHFVAHHFLTRGPSILSAIEQYLQGGVFVGQMNASVRVSSKFKADLSGIKPMLMNALSNIILEPYRQSTNSSEATANQGPTEPNKALDSSSEASTTVGSKPNTALASSPNAVSEFVEHKLGMVQKKLASFLKKFCMCSK